MCVDSLHRVEDAATTPTITSTYTTPGVLTGQDPTAPLPLTPNGDLRLTSDMRKPLTEASTRTQRISETSEGGRGGRLNSSEKYRNKQSIKIGKLINNQEFAINDLQY